MNMFNRYLTRRRFIKNAAVAALAGGSLITHAQTAYPAQPALSAEQKNLLALLLAPNADVAALGVFIPPDQVQRLDYAGDFNSAGWTAQLQGTYLGSPVGINYTGLLDAAQNTVSWQASGSVGARSVQTVGSITFISDSPLQATLAANGTLSALQTSPDDEWSVGGEVSKRDGKVTVGVTGSYGGDVATASGSGRIDLTTGNVSGGVAVDIHPPKEDIRVRIQAYVEEDGSVEASVRVRKLKE